MSPRGQGVVERGAWNKIQVRRKTGVKGRETYARRTVCGYRTTIGLTSTASGGGGE